MKLTKEPRLHQKGHCVGETQEKYLEHMSQPENERKTYVIDLKSTITKN